MQQREFYSDTILGISEAGEGIKRGEEWEKFKTEHVENKEHDYSTE